MIEELIQLSHKFLKIKNSDYRRYLIQTAPFTHRLSIITGEGGVGKTTTIVQSLLDKVDRDYFSPKILYIQADHFLMKSTSLYEIAEKFQLLGGKWIGFDEIHKYPNWSMELKSIYDTFPDLNVYASGSSALEIYKGSHDLTRRAATYRMRGLSFREFLELLLKVNLEPFTLENICQSHLHIASSIVDTLKKIDQQVLPLFYRYLREGYYPYFLELNNEALYHLTLEQNLHTTIESDLVSICPELSGNSIMKMKQLLMYIASVVPFTPNWLKIKTILKIGDLRTLKNYFDHLERAGIIATISKVTQKMNQLESTGKVYLNNPNQLFAICSETPNLGTLRETFFLSVVSQNNHLSLPVNGDFLVDNKALFEVGGRSKNFKQIRSEQNSYLACDEIEIGVGNKIPLWLFGFIY